MRFPAAASFMGDTIVRHFSLIVCACGALLALTATAQAQSFGIELHNTLMPASGGMGGASLSAPQDLTSAMNGNPSTLTQFRGTQFTFGGAWAEATFNMRQDSNIPIIGPPLIEPFRAKSTAPGSPIGNIGVTQDFSALGLPATFGLGFVTTAGAGIDFRHIPASHGTNANITIFSMPAMLGVDLTNRLSVGAGTSLGIAFFDGPFVGSGGMTPDYNLRGSLGANLEVTDNTSVGAFYQTKQVYKFDNAVVFDPGLNQRAFDVNMELPHNVGFGVANTTLMDGNLLLAVDVIYKLWEETALFGSIYDNQWVVQLGAQQSIGRLRLRAGYTWAQNPINDTPFGDIGGVIQPGDLPAVRYTQSLLAVTGQHRISGGVGVVDVLPGLDLDLMAGGMFEDSQQLGDFAFTSIESYWIGMGLTWRFRRGACCGNDLPPDNWCRN